MKPDEDYIALAGCGCLAIVCKLAFIILVVWVILHFIIKLW